MSEIREVSDPELGIVRELLDDDGTVVASCAVSPIRTDGAVIYVDESHVFRAGGGLLPTPDELRELWG